MWEPYINSKRRCFEDLSMDSIKRRRFEHVPQKQEIKL
jgi:hypothetical protein